MLNKIISQLLVASLIVSSVVGIANAGSFLSNSKYMWDKNEGRWVTKFRIGAAVPFGYKEEWHTSDNNFFQTTVNLEAEINYRFSEHLSFATSLGYQPNSTGEWTYDPPPAGGPVVSTTGRISLLPITAMVQYHFAPYGQMRPYVGAGYHYTIGRSTYDAIDVDNGHGPALQAGVDWWLEKSWGINFEIKQMWFTTHVDVSELVGSSGEGGEVEPDPTIASIGLMYRF